jgi:phosphoribosylaminoimidazole-succinocarboxamide synthase
MITLATVRTTELPFRLHARGKVRDVYDVGGNRLLLVATDRISAFDVVMTQAIPSKGEVLTQITAWWLDQLADIVPNHLISANPHQILKELPELEASFDVWAWRSTLVRRTAPFPVECVVRGYIAGSAWKEYRDTGTLAGEEMQKGLRESSRLDAPIFSPATKAEEGHDENITFAQVAALVGNPMAESLRRLSLEIYARGRDIAEKAGIIIADTKFEFGTEPDGKLLLIDEVLTPDSSRFWPRDAYAEGRGQPSLDKQPVRDYLEALVQVGQWNREAPPPDLTPEVVQATSARYRNVYERLTGSTLEQNRERAP